MRKFESYAELRTVIAGLLSEPFGAGSYIVNELADLDYEGPEFDALSSAFIEHQRDPELLEEPSAPFAQAIIDGFGLSTDSVIAVTDALKKMEKMP